MKKNFLIMMIMLLCSGFAFAQINTVRGFVPGAGTGAQGNNHQTYAVFGQMFGNIDLNAANPYEVAEGLAQAQLIADTVEAVVGCGDSLKIGDFTLSAAAIDAIVAEFAADPTRPRDTFLTLQRTNAAIYNYDRLMVLHLFVCPCTIKDADTHEYEVVAIDNICWTKTNMRATTTCGGIEVVTKSYSTDVTPELDPATFGLLYTWENASKDSKCDSNYVTGICPCGWHLPTAAEVDTILKSYTNDLRSNGGYWVVPEGITNLTKFTAEPAGYFDSLATRFEGFHSEADFWYVATDSTCNADYFQIYYFCDKPKHEPRNVNTDAMSVRCVLDMIYDYHKDDPTPNPQPQPTPNCPTITINPAGFEKVEGKITPYSPNDNYIIVVTGSYTGVFQDDPTFGDLLDEEVVDINENGTFTWYPNYNNYDIDEFTSITGQFIINGPVEGCSKTIDFTTAQDCNLSVGPLSFVDGVAQVEITNFDPDYFEDIQIEYNGDQSYHPTSDDFETVPGSNITTLSHQLPSGANSVDALFELKHNYYACGEDDEYYIIRTLCPTVSDFDVTADGVSVSVNNYDPNEIELEYWKYQIIYNDNNPNEWIEDQNVQPQVNNGVATFTSSIPSLPTMDNVQAIKVYVRFIFSSSQCYPQGDDDYDISTTVYSQQ